MEKRWKEQGVGAEEAEALIERQSMEAQELADCPDVTNKTLEIVTPKEPESVFDEPTSADISEVSEGASLPTRLQAAIQSLSDDTRNALLLQAVQHYVQVKHFRDSLLVRVGLLDPHFASFLLKESEQEGQD